MPPRAAWLTRIPHILQQLTELECPVVDRAICEKLFGVRRRRAIELMHYFGGYRSGNTVLLDRIGLVQKLQELENSPPAVSEFKRKQRLTNKLDELHRMQAARRVKLHVREDVQDLNLFQLTPDVSLSPGRLTIGFTDPADLFSKLYEFSQVAANDFEAVCQAIEPRPQTAEPP